MEHLPMTETLTIEKEVHFQARSRGHKELRRGREPSVAAELPVPVPRLARLMALAIRCDRLVSAGDIQDHAELARLAHVSRARICQILALLHLAPDIQEEILFLEGRPRGRSAMLLAQLLPITALADWAKQRRRWQALRRRSAAPC
jgi:hypothetical protein